MRLRELLEQSFVRRVAQLAAPAGAHLVGGALRDQLLGRPFDDLDLVVPRDAERLARELAAELGARPVRLGADPFATWRLVGDGPRIDLGVRQGATLAADLVRRDLTVNSLGLGLADGVVHDPTGGLDDLERRLLRSVSPAVYVDDPLRILRLVRFAVTLPGFSVDAGTIEMARARADRLRTVAAERIREELRATLAGIEQRAVRLLAAVGVYPAFWLAGAGGTADVARAAAELERLAVVAARAPGGEPAAPPIDAFAANLAVLISNLRLPGDATRHAVLESLHARGLLANRERRRVGVLLDRQRPPVGLGERRWFLHRAGDLWSTAVAVAAVRDGEDPAAAVDDLARLAAAEGEAIFAPPPLLDGTEVSRRAGVPPGPELGRLVRRLRRAQIEGRIGTPAEAVALLAELSSPEGAAD